MADLDDLTAALESALREGPTPHTVRWRDEAGVDVLFYDPVHDNALGGILHIPAALLDD